MASWTELLIVSGFAVVFYAWIGCPLSLRLAPPQIAALLAPAVGWAIHSALALPVLMIAGMSRAVVIAAFAIPAAAALLAYRRSGAALRHLTEPRLLAALTAAIVLSLVVAAGVMPKVSPQGVTFAGPIFDHSKVAIVDEIARLGVPPANPAFGGEGGGRLSYYYLWHFSAAEVAHLLGIRGWSADAGLTAFTAFASLAAVMGFAVLLSGRAVSALWVVVLAVAASLRPLLAIAVDPLKSEDVIGEQSGLGAWLFQTSWAPQHVASATAAVLAALTLVRLAETPGIVVTLLLALTMAASFGSSTWIGGIVLPLAAVVIAMAMLERATAARLRLFAWLAGAALIALLLIAPLLYAQLAMAAMRAGGAPVVIAPYAVLGFGGPAWHIANLAAYWVIFLVVEFPAIYLTGLVSLYWLMRTAPAGRRAELVALAVLLVVSLIAAWLLRSTLGENNDLGWRAVLPAVLLLMAFAAAGLTHLMQAVRAPLAVGAVILLLFGLPDGVDLIRRNLDGAPEQTSASFARSAELWQAVRQYAAPSERIANNPLSFMRMTPWPGNMSWALMANRRSCYAGDALVGPLAGLSPARQASVEAQFERVFDGGADPDEVAQLATRYNCSVIVLTPDDGAWTRDPFASSSYYRLVEGDARWRIYKLVKLAANDQIPANQLKPRSDQ